MFRFCLLFFFSYPFIALGNFGLDFHSQSIYLKNAIPLPGGNTQLILENNSTICLAKINQNGALLDYKTYNFSYPLRNLGKLNFNYQHIYLLESVRINNKDYTCILKIDTSGLLLQSAIFKDSTGTSTTFQNTRLSNSGEPYLTIKKSNLTYCLKLDTNLNIYSSHCFQSLLFADFLPSGELFFGKSYAGFIPIFQTFSNYGTDVFKMDLSSNISYFNSYISQEFIPNQDDQKLEIKSIFPKSANEFLFVVCFPYPYGIMLDDVPQFTFIVTDTIGQIRNIPPYIRSAEPHPFKSSNGELYSYNNGFQHFTIVPDNLVRFDSLFHPNLSLSWQITGASYLAQLNPNHFDTINNQLFHTKSLQFLSYNNLDSISNSCYYSTNNLYPDTLPIFEDQRNPTFPVLLAQTLVSDTLAFLPDTLAPNWSVCKCIRGSTGPNLDFDYCTFQDSIFLQITPQDSVFANYDSVKWIIGSTEIDDFSQLNLAYTSANSSITLKAWNACGERTIIKAIYLDSTEMVQFSDTLLCPNQSATLQPENFHSQVNWYKDGQFIATGNSILASSPGNYSYTYPTGANCYQSSLPIRIEAAQPFSPDLKFCTSQNQLTANLLFNIPNPIYDSLIWQVGGISFTDSLAIHSQLSDSLFLTIWSACQNFHFAEKLIPDSTETILATAPTLCDSNDVIYLYPSNPHYPLHWILNGAIIDSTNLSIEINQPGLYSYSYWLDSNCLHHSQPFEIVQSNSQATLVYDSLQGILLANPALNSIIWKDEFGNFVGTGPSFQPITSGTYTYEAVDSLSCTIYAATITISLEIVGIDKSLNLNNFYIKNMYNMLGEKLQNSKEAFPFPDLSDGVYIIQLTNQANSSQLIQKIIVLQGVAYISKE
ncbi:MAG: hypothetical protein K1X82_10770 [Bacteroidia bacterium]|nr:hypothetical protein [Bacteroidia bacterium]